MKLFIFIFTLLFINNNEIKKKTLMYNYFDMEIEYYNDFTNQPILSELWATEYINKHININTCVGFLIINNDGDELILDFNFYRYKIKDIKINISNSIDNIPINIEETPYNFNNIFSNNQLFFIDIKKYNIDTLYITSEIIVLDENKKEIKITSGNLKKEYGSIGWDGLRWVWYSEYFLKKKINF